MSPVEHERKVAAFAACARQRRRGARSCRIRSRQADLEPIFAIVNPRCPRIGLRHFNEVIAVDAAAGSVEAEGMTSYVDLVDATLARGTMPCVVPQLKSITIGGALAGVGIEATSFRHGLAARHRQRVRRADRRRAHRSLHAGQRAQRAVLRLPNSYGTLGYVLRVTLGRCRCGPSSRSSTAATRGPTSAFADVARLCAAEDIDFLDGVAFAPGDLVLTLGRFVDTRPPPVTTRSSASTTARCASAAATS